MHGAGIIAVGHVMDFLNSVTGAAIRDEFASGLRLLKEKDRLERGGWEFGAEGPRWNGVSQLSLHLVQVLKRRLAESVRQREKP